ncbi:MAG: 5-(carboxyamino)imidazole ribonucleotide mutase [Alphaproteobacteria bacterium]|nr:5-(carboxyamino)imidazole ribonucleotide mutase [Alphaproteobacteria bacterium]
MASDKKSTGNTPSGALFPPTPTRVAIVMGSASDWPTMRHAAELCLSLEIDFFARIVSAHRTPKRLVQFAEQAADHGVHVIIAGAGGAAHLPGMIASLTSLPVLGVPVQSKALSGMDSLLSIVQMPGGVPVGTLSIGDSGAKNAALLAARVLALADAPLRQRLAEWTEKTTRSVGLTITPDADATA